MASKRLWYLCLILLFCFQSIMAQENQPTQEPLPTYPEIATLGRGQLRNGSWRSDGEAVLLNSSQGAAVYSIDFKRLRDFKDQWQAAFSPDGQFLATTTLEPYELHLWDAKTYRKINTYPLTLEPHRYMPEMIPVSWSPDRAYIAVPGGTSVDVIAADSGQMRKSHPIDRYVTDVNWRPDGHRLAISQLGDLLILDPFTGELDRRFKEAKTAWRASWSPDQSLFATAMIDKDGYSVNDVKIWDAESGKLNLVIQAPYTHTFAWSPDSQYVATGDYDNRDSILTFRLFVWNARTGEHVNTLWSTSPTTHINYQQAFISTAWSPDGTHLLTVSEDNVARIHDWPFEYKEIEHQSLGYQGQLTGIAWNQSGTQIVVSSEDSGLHIWDVETRQPIRRLQAPYREVDDVDWNPQMDEIAFSTKHDLIYTSTLASEGAARVTDYNDFWEADWPPIVAYSPNGQILTSSATIGGGGEITLSSGEFYRDEVKIRLSGWPAFSLSWTTDSRFLAYDDRRVAYVYDVETQTTRTFTCGGDRHSDPFFDATAISPDGKILAIADYYSGVCLIDTETGESLPVPMTDRFGLRDVQLNGFAWNPDSTRLASITNYDGSQAQRYARVAVWDVAEGTLIAAMDVPGGVGHIAWSPDGTQLAATGANGLIHIWQASD